MPSPPERLYVVGSHEPVPGREQKLATILSDFAHTLGTDFPIQRILDELVERTVELLSVSAAGVTLIAADRSPHFVAASDGTALEFERLQSRLREGPCLSAHRSGQAVTIPDLAADRTYPAFGPAAVGAGMAAVFTFPLRGVGALDLYSDQPCTLDSWELSTAQTLADVATAYLLNAQARVKARETAEQLRESALHDPLTGLANRALLLERLERAAARGRRKHADLAVLFVDLDRFKLVNDRYGHQVGDAMLVAITQRLTHLLRPVDTLARLAGDEFVVLCEDLARPSDAEALARRVGAAFAAPFVVGGVEISITASVGIAYAGDSDDLPSQLMRDADAAMYQAKRGGGGQHRRIAGGGGDVSNGAFVDLELDLRKAFAAGELEVHYQPIQRSLDGRLIGAEALLRWTHPSLGPVQATDMVAVAERSSLISEIGAWVLERACDDRRRWVRASTAALDEPLEIAVNVSASQLMAPGFASTVDRVVRLARIEPSDLVLELTESAQLGADDNSTDVLGVLSELKSMGVRIALDDFGTGYSSLQYLRAFPVDILKIDQSFVADLGRHSATGAILTAVTNLAHVLGLSVTAEGVETQAQYDAVVAIGCESVQGYYFGQPMPSAQFERMVTDSATFGIPGNAVSASGSPVRDAGARG